MKPNSEILQQVAENFNAKFPPGSAVWLHDSTGKATPAIVLGPAALVVNNDGIRRTVSGLHFISNNGRIDLRDYERVSADERMEEIVKSVSETMSEEASLMVATYGEDATVAEALLLGLVRLSVLMAESVVRSGATSEQRTSLIAAMRNMLVERVIEIREANARKSKESPAPQG